MKHILYIKVLAMHVMVAAGPCNPLPKIPPPPPFRYTELGIVVVGQVYKRPKAPGYLAKHDKQQNSWLTQL